LCISTFHHSHLFPSSCPTAFHLLPGPYTTVLAPRPSPPATRLYAFPAYAACCARERASAVWPSVLCRFRVALWWTGCNSARVAVRARVLLAAAPPACWLLRAGTVHPAGLSQADAPLRRRHSASYYTLFTICCLSLLSGTVRVVAPRQQAPRRFVLASSALLYNAVLLLGWRPWFIKLLCLLLVLTVLLLLASSHAAPPATTTARMKRACAYRYLRWLLPPLPATATTARICCARCACCARAARATRALLRRILTAARCRRIPGAHHTAHATLPHRYRAAAPAAVALTAALRRRLLPPTTATLPRAPANGGSCFARAARCP